MSDENSWWETWLLNSAAIYFPVLGIYLLFSPSPSGLTSLILAGLVSGGVLLLCGAMALGDFIFFGLWRPHHPARYPTPSFFPLRLYSPLHRTVASTGKLLAAECPPAHPSIRAAVRHAHIYDVVVRARQDVNGTVLCGVIGYVRADGKYVPDVNGPDKKWPGG